jgi:hypothetical protein
LKLYFKNSQGRERLIAECETTKDVSREIHKFLDDHNYKSYYSRSWGDEEKVMIDVGSYSEFFVLRDISHSEYIKGLKSDEDPEEKYHQITWDEYLESLQKNRE